jgi:hypothetical protein
LKIDIKAKNKPGSYTTRTGLFSIKKGRTRIDLKVLNPTHLVSSGKRKVGHTDQRLGNNEGRLI